MWLSAVDPELSVVLASASVRCREVSGRQDPVRLPLKERPRRSGPPAWDEPPVEAVPDRDALAQPQPEYVFNHQVQW